MKNLQRQANHRDILSEFVEHSQNSLRMPIIKRKSEQYTLMDNVHRRDGLHSEFVEPSRNSLKAVSVSKSQVQAADHVDRQSVPLTGYEHFPQEMQTYPVTVQPTNPDNNSAC